MTLGHVHVMCVLLAVKFLLAVDAAISPEFMQWYPHPNVSASPHREHFTVVSIKASTNKVLEAHRNIVTGKAASRGRFNEWMYSKIWDYSTICGCWRLTLSLGCWISEAGKKRPNLTDFLSAHSQWMGSWRCLRLNQGELSVPIVAAMCGVLFSVYKVNRVRRCCWQGFLLTLSTQAQGRYRGTQRCCTAPEPRSKLQPGHGPNRPWLSCKGGKKSDFHRSYLYWVIINKKLLHAASTCWSPRSHLTCVSHRSDCTCT